VINRLRVTLLLLALLLPLCAEALVVRAVRVENIGTGPVDEGWVRAYTSLQPGEEFTRNAVSRDVKALQESGRFARVTASVERHPDGFDVIYGVQARPRLRRVNVEGADFLSPARIRKMLELEPGDLVDDSLVAEKTREVIDHYRSKHYPFAKVTWNIRDVGTQGEAVLEILVEEGQRALIGEIDFDGRDQLTEKALVKAMEQRKANWLSWITKAGTYDPDELELDLFKIKQLYHDRGYLDAAVGRPVVKDLGRGRISISIPIEEGLAYFIKEVSLSGITLFPEEQVRKVLTLHKGDVASLGQVQRNAQAVRDYFGSRGYVRTNVETELDADPARQQVGVSYTVTEGSLAYIRNIRIRGNTRTQDKVIRRELAVYPGEVYDAVRIRRSEQRLRNLNYFSSVFSAPQETPILDQYDLHFDVEEKKTGQFIVGAGFSSIDDLIGFVELSQGNFDIKGWPHFTGAGQKMKIRAQGGSSRSDLEVSFTEPWFLDRRLAFNTTFFRNDRRFLSDDYDQRNTGGSVSLSHALIGPNRIRYRYQLENVDVYDVDDTASDLIKAEEGNRTQSSVEVQITHDTRDNFFIPTRGNRTLLSVTLAGGPLGAETDTYGCEIRSAQYWPLWLDHVFTVRGWVGFVEEYGDTDHVPIFDRLFLGGARTLRGFDYRDVGPRDDTGEAIGGRSAWTTTAEYTIPLVAIVRMAVFYDIGQVDLDAFALSSDGYNSDWGVGLRLDLPQFPLNLDYAWPIETDEYNDKSGGRFNFMLGYMF
jgi:outer membrane protein insertion porin family